MKMVLLTHLLADFPNEKGGLAGGLSRSSVALVIPVLSPEEDWSGSGSHSTTRMAP